MRRKKIISMTMLMILMLTMTRNCNDVHADVVDSERKMNFYVDNDTNYNGNDNKTNNTKNMCCTYGMTQMITKL